MELWQTIPVDREGFQKMLTYTGKVMDIFNPAPEMISIEDIAHHLSLLNRFTGATRMPYSVAQHCIQVADLLPPSYKLVGLLHDSAEAYLNDITTGLKRALPVYKELEENLLACIFAKFGVPFDDIPPIVKQADTFMLAWEQTCLMPESDAWKPMLTDGELNKIEHKYGGLQLMTPEEAEDEYLWMYKESEFFTKMIKDLS